MYGNLDLPRESTTPPTSTAPDEVNPEFLAALPLNIQEEVLAQQRQERQRQVAASANPNDPFDAAAFFQNLPSSLRQSVRVKAGILTLPDKTFRNNSDSFTDFGGY